MQFLYEKDRLHDMQEEKEDENRSKQIQIDQVLIITAQNTL